MNIVAITQARMGSTRLPGKVLKDLGGETALGRHLRRALRASTVSKLVVATSTLPADEAIVKESRRHGVDTYRGSENDVLDRYYQCALHYKADAVVRLTSDCPLIEPTVIDRVVTAFREAHVDYASNKIKPTYPRGLDCEVLTMQALAAAWREATGYHRTHVTLHVYEHPERFKLLNVAHDKDYSAMRWTLDTPEDLDFLQAVYNRMGRRDDFAWTDVVTMLQKEPDLMRLNAHVRQKDPSEG